MSRQRALDAIHLQPTDRIPQMECLQHPDFERALTGIDPYRHPQQARLKLLDLLDLDFNIAGVPGSDAPIENLFTDGASSKTLEDGRHVVRWGTSATSHWDWGSDFTNAEQVLAYDPLQKMPAGTVETLAAEYQASLDQQRALAGDRYLATGGTYLTLFMWPMMTFGWELFLEVAAAEPERFKELMDGFALVTERVMHAWARTDVEVVTCHDDICMSRGTVFSPAWLEEVIYPHYTRFWQILHAAGKKVLFISDGRVNPIADAIFACGADGLFAEPHTDLEPLVAQYGDRKFFFGNVDSRIISYGTPATIEAEVQRCVAMGQHAPGYCIGVTNEITYNAPIENVFAYFHACQRYCRR
jgi:hypothetical protein